MKSLMLAAMLFSASPAVAEDVSELATLRAQLAKTQVKTTKGKVKVSVSYDKGHTVSLTPEEWRHVLALQPVILDACMQVDRGLVK